MNVWVGRTLAVAASLCWLGTAAFAADKAPNRPYGTIPKIAIPASGAFEIPEFGDETEIHRVYLTKTGSLLIAFGFMDHGVLHSDIYDPQTHQRRFPDQSARAAQDNSVEFGFVKSHALEMLYPLSGVKFGKNKEVGQDFEGGRICPNNPYMIVTTIGDLRQDDRIEFMVFEKLKRPDVLHLDHNCFTSKTVTLRYGTPAFSFYSNEDGFLAEGGRFLIWFDWTGHSRFFDHRNDFVIVPANKIRPILNEGREDGGAASAKAFRKADDLIDRFGQQQMKRPNHG